MNYGAYHERRIPLLVRAGSRSRLEKGRWILSSYERFIDSGRIIDLGCGEGGLLLALREKGRTDIVGVDSNPELCGLADSFGLPVIRQDLLPYVCRNGKREPIFIWTSSNMFRSTSTCKCLTRYRWEAASCKLPSQKV